MAHAEQLARQGQACWYRDMEKLQLKAAILDWAGTVVDHGSRAPMGAFVRACAQFGVAISIADARGPMGMAKWEDFVSLEPKDQEYSCRSCVVRGKRQL
jgi:hypothetical protein